MTCSIIVRAAVISSFHIVSPSPLLALQFSLLGGRNGAKEGGSGISGVCVVASSLVGPPVLCIFSLFIFANGYPIQMPSAGADSPRKKDDGQPTSPISDFRQSHP
jgi:hypothetical protein